MGDGRNKPAQRCFFLIPKNVTSERPIAFLRTLIRWCEDMRAPEVAKWRRYRWPKWRSSTNSLGNFDGNGEVRISSGRKKIWGVVALVLDQAKAFERVSLPVVWAWATHVSFQWKILRALCWYFEHQRRVQFEGCVAEPLQTITAILPGSK